MTTVVVDTHVLHWVSADPTQLSPTATRAIDEADHLAVSAITWYELAWLVRHERILVTIPPRAWLDRLASHVETVAVTPSIADTAVSLPTSFPRDPADRLIYATAIERGWRLVTKDRALRAHRYPRPVTLW